MEKEKETLLPEERRVPEYLVCIGSSAGGLEALTNLLANLPSRELPVSVLVAQHLSPNHKSHMVQLLGKNSRWQVVEANHKDRLEPGKVYITPPDRDIILEEEQILLSKPPSEIGPKPNVNLLFSSVARNYQEKTIGVILSGTGSDGANGVNAIKEMGGLTFVQNPDLAAYDGMPISAIETGAVDDIIKVDQFGKILTEICNGSYENPKLAKQDEEVLNDLTRIFELLEKKTGVDFSHYKMSTIQRRLESRIAHLRINSLKSYLKYIEENPTEVSELFNHVLIGVTHFFRDPHAFEALKKELEALIKRKSDQTLRVWTPGCATGEEAYTISIIISEILGKEIAEWNIQIFATDIDDDAIAFGRRGKYPKAALDLMDPKLVKNYFNQNSDGLVEVNKSLRSLILFSRHDLTSNPPFLKLDLISCRNLLIYFNIELQKRVIPVFHYALEKDALLFLGKSENLGVHSELFNTIDKKFKIWTRKVGSSPSAPRFRPLRPAHLAKSKSSRVSFEIKSIPERVEDTLYGSFSHPYVVINEQNEILYVNGDVSPFLKFNQGTMTANLLKQCIKEVELILHSTVQSAIKSLESQFSQPRRLKDERENILYRIVVHPMLHFKDTQFLVIFEHFDVDKKLLAAEDQSNIDYENIRIAELQQELDSTREHLQSYIEELETANEEMQALNEELQSTNEELQSVNEELETSNEEMQSTNEEMHIAYQELRDMHDLVKAKELELQRNNLELNSLLNNELQGFVLFSEDFQIRQFNSYARDKFKVLSGKIIKEGNSLLKFIPKDWLSTFVDESRQLLKEGETIHKKMKITIEGLEYHFEISLSPVLHAEHEKDITLGIMDVSASSKLQQEMQSLKELMDEAGSVVNMGGWELDLESGKTTWTQQVYEIHEVAEDYLSNLSKGLQFYPPAAQAILNENIEQVIKSGRSFDLNLPFITAKKKNLTVRVTGNPTYEDGKVVKLWGIIQDITQSYESQRKMELLNKDLQRSNEELEDFAYVASHDLQEPLRMVYSFVQLLEDRLKDKVDDKGKQYINHIEQGAQRMQNMLRDLLEYSRVNTNSDSKEEVALSEVVKNSLKDLSARIKKSKAEVEFGKLPTVYAIPSQMERLFINILSNAIKYCKRSPKIKIGFEEREDSYLVYIRDNGIGIEKQYHEKIFTIFQRLHNREEYEGNGVGLAVCKRIMNKHHGLIYVESEPAEGSTFYLEFPKS